MAASARLAISWRKRALNCFDSRLAVRHNSTTSAAEQESGDQWCSDIADLVRVLGENTQINASGTVARKKKNPIVAVAMSRKRQWEPAALAPQNHTAAVASSVVRHERTHTGEKPHGCRYCDYRAASATQVKTHERTHTGEKPYGCLYCEYRAASATHVKTHERTHTGDKPFGCRHCGYRAAHASHVAVHERTHTGEKPYGCHFCDYRAVVKASVTKHERTVNC